MLSTVYSSGLFGIDGVEVVVECNMQDKIPCFEIVGLPDTAVKEAENRAMILIPLEKQPRSIDIDELQNEGYETLHFDASRSNSIYGNSNTVQPPALTLLPCIKY